MSSDLAIRAHALSKVFQIYRKPHHRLLQWLDNRPGDRWHRDFHALRSVDLEVRRGETVGIVGRNGSGKSTLLQLICGTLEPTSGELMVNGRIAALLELGAGFNPEFTGRENVFLYGSVLGLSRALITERFDTIADFAEIGDFMGQPVKNYSSGMYVRLAFAVAINVTPEILVVDEALSVGDEAFQRKCFAKIDQIRDAGATILFVSHSAGTVVDLCDRAVLLDQGELLAQGTPKDIVSRYQKLLYAPIERVQKVRDEIRSEHRRTLGEPNPVHQREGDGPKVLPDVVAQAYWEPDLRPSSTIAYENRGARIEDPHLQTIDGRRVNVLVAGDEYIYVYRVEVERSLARVRCGMMIKSVTGIEVGGAASTTEEFAIPLVERDETLSVRFRFRCMLAPGVYFLNAGVLSVMGEGEDYVDRRIDIAMFRVMPEASRLATGLVDLHVIPHVQVSR